MRMRTGGRFTCFRLRCPTKSSGLRCSSILSTATHAYAPLYLPLAARGNAAIPNTEVKLMYADNTWRATAREDR